MDLDDSVEASDLDRRGTYATPKRFNSQHHVQTACVLLGVLFPPKYPLTHSPTNPPTHQH